ncbi:hypothetical protein D3C78_818470 [compost metagenome]
MLSSTLTPRFYTNIKIFNPDPGKPLVSGGQVTQYWRQSYGNRIQDSGLARSIFPNQHRQSGMQIQLQMLKAPEVVQGYLVQPHI